MDTPKFFKVSKTGVDKLQKELEQVQRNVGVLQALKEETVQEFERKKQRLRQITDSNKFFKQLKQYGEIQDKPKFSPLIRDKLLSYLDKWLRLYLSVSLLIYFCTKQFEYIKMPSFNDIPKILEELRFQTTSGLPVMCQSDFIIPEDISLIQNQYDIICNDLKKMKLDLQDRVKIVDKTELIMNILNYKIYEVRYNFRAKIHSLKEAKDALTSVPSDKNESEVALQLFEIDKEMLECEHVHESQMQSIKEQKLEAQKHYEDAVNILDTALENIRKYYNILLLLIQAEKEQLSDLQNEIAEVKHTIILEGLQKDIDHFTQLQTAGWRTKKPLEEMSVFLEERGLKLTDSGLLMTDKGHQITYEEAREQKLLDDITFSLDLYAEKVKDDVSSNQSREGSKGSNYSRMSSEDVQYLKENLGIPLTLALAEITAVQPRDPIHYLGHWLFKFRYNQEIGDIQRIEMEQINDERERIAKEKWHKMMEEEAEIAVLECIMRAEQESARNEVLRIQRELEAAEELEQDNWDMELRDQFPAFD